ncbi:MAG: hypothetical protein UU16_C0033G0008 [Candidatus Woesebacteria bacterium GW2011_GWA2_40_7]|uniref:Type II secretion system protein G n=3 Tax=Candidatus Woeseibacteriota TaxID=1752722 RepID=A0A0G0XXB9_9BACT|nr:MAG: hypothetical protein UT17_C0002G0072 [Candidatus Woesebacteria bacterium GW2011_GWB1_39_10]KKR73012.1 MAG: hypothetical protein UU16_C0033G0008 [Candidatus Woesebacteria bacterium GW2011_GWA2_40_7]KKR92577.1 MAG: hypothetical protein UU42_C0001G0181 [Candidatus Woesebacteria bacterium GW2011_GWA1_41_13b]
MKLFTKEETLSVIIIFVVLIAISVPNFVSSIKRSRDQVRRDDMGALSNVLASYRDDFGAFPPSQDGMILGCKKEGDNVQIGKDGKLTVNLIPCRWGKDSLVDLTPGSSKVYLKIMPRDPDLDKGVTYTYFSDGSTYQVFASFEVETEPEYDPKILSRNIMCGVKICNMGRGFGCTTNKSLEQCEQERFLKK